MAASTQKNEIKAALGTLTPHLLMAGLFSGAINLLYLSSPLYLLQVYNRVLVSESMPTLLLLTLILVVALVTMAILDAIRAQVLIRCGIRLDGLLSQRVFEALVRRSAAQGFSMGAQTLREFDNFRAFVTGPGIYFAFDLPWIPLYLLLLFFIHPVLGAVATVGALALLGLAIVNEFATRRSMQSAEAAGNQSYAFTENILRHADVVQAMGMQPAVERQWQGSRFSMLGDQAFASDRNASMSATIRFARLLLQSLMLGTGAWLAIGNAIMPATIFAASIIMGRALVPVEQVVFTWKQFNSAREGYRKVSELLAKVPAQRSRSLVPKEASGLKVDNLVYLAANRPEPILKGLSFELEPGKAYGMVGPSGSGKSTLARVIVGAIQPTRGKMRFGGLDYDNWDHVRFGQEVGYLPQDVGLFSGTVRENIARFGNASIEEIVETTRTAGVHDMILSLPQQYDTPLGPDGVGLSGGQRQRLGLARALLGKPSLLVLDEPNANLDTSGEEALKSALLALKASGTTIVLITHRTTVLEVVDALMVVRGGALELIGTPETVYDHIKRGLIRPPGMAA